MSNVAISKNQMSNSVMDNVNEESRIKSYETGNMKAMLKVGKDFIQGEADGSVSEGDDMRDVTVAPSFTVEEIGVDPQEVHPGENEDEDVCPFAEHDVLFDADVDPGDVQFGVSGSGEAGDVAAVGDDAGSGGNTLMDLSETQDVDKIVYENNPSNGRCLFTSNEEKYRGRNQLLGMPTKNEGGVNGRVGRVSEVDLDLNEGDLQQPEPDRAAGLLPGDSAGALGCGSLVPSSPPRRSRGADEKSGATSKHSGLEVASRVKRQGSVAESDGSDQVQPAKRAKKAILEGQLQDALDHDPVRTGELEPRKKRHAKIVLDADELSSDDSVAAKAKSSTHLPAKVAKPDKAKTLPAPKKPGSRPKPDRTAVTKGTKSGGAKKRGGGSVFGRRR